MNICANVRVVMRVPTLVLHVPSECTVQIKKGDTDSVGRVINLETRVKNITKTTQVKKHVNYVMGVTQVKHVHLATFKRAQLNVLVVKRANT